MNASASDLYLSVEDYLKFEAEAQVRHEYIGGRIHAMSGTTVRHGVIVTNLATNFHGHLRGGPCKTLIAEVKVQLEVHREDIFYYPDIMVACEHEGLEKHFLRHPKLIVEVLSPSTEATDRREKLLNYPLIASLEEYVIVAQDSREITLHRRAEHWRPTQITATDAPVEFRSINLTIPLAQIYEGVF